FASREKRLFGPILWKSCRVPRGFLAALLLIEVRCDNDDSVGGNAGACVPPIGPSPCPYGSDPLAYWNVGLLDVPLTFPGRWLTDRPRPRPPWWPTRSTPGAAVEYAFEVGSPSSEARFIEILIDKPRELANTPMTLLVAQTRTAPNSRPRSSPAELA